MELADELELYQEAEELHSGEVIRLLQKIDGGYEPTPSELEYLRSIEQLHYNTSPIDPPLTQIPASISLLAGLRVLNLNFNSIINLEPLSELTRLKSLNLSGNSIINLEPLSGLTGLKSLDLNHNSIINLEPLSELTGLESLNLSGNSIINLEPLSGLTGLKSLDLNHNSIINLEPLSELTGLESLNLSGNSIINLEPLSGLTGLDALYLSSNSISNLEPLAGLTGLETLDLDNNSISNLEPLADLIALEYLHLSNNSISNLEPLAGLTRLDTLYVARNSISDLIPLTGLTKLIQLVLWGNPIHDLSPLKGLAALENLDLSLNYIQDLTALENLPNLNKLDLYGATLLSIPVALALDNYDFCFDADTFGSVIKGIRLEHTELKLQPVSLFQQPKELIRAYYEAEQVPVKEGKVIVLGNAGVGKTHTIQRIKNGGNPIHYKIEPTPGIEVDVHSLTATHHNREFSIRFWDFGGQEVMHAMHRCFMTQRTLYLVIVTTRYERETGEARFWLRNIQSFAPNAPVLLAVNRWGDIETSGLDMNSLKREFPNLLPMPVYYSAVDPSPEDFGQLTKAIIREAAKLDSTAMYFPAQWAAIRRDIQAKAEKEHYLSREDYHQICADHGLVSEEIRSWLLEWFNDLGVCFSYHQDESSGRELENYQVLNPKWLTNAIYILINAGKHYADNGKLHKNNIHDLLFRIGNGILPIQYEDFEQGYVLDVMRKFRLSYPASDTHEFIPALCGANSPEDLYPVGLPCQVSYQLEYIYLPDSIVHQLMIRYYKYLNQDKLWRKGLRIDMELLGLIAVLEMGTDDRTLRINVYSDGREAPWKLLSDLRGTIASINRSLGLKAEEFIVISTDNGDHAVSVDELLDRHQYGDRTYTFYTNQNARKREERSIGQLLGMTFGEETIAAVQEKARQDNQSFVESFRGIKIDTVNFYSAPQSQPDISAALEYMIRHQCQTNERLMDCLIEALSNSPDHNTRELAGNAKKDTKGFLEKLAGHAKNAATVATSGQTLYKAGAAIVEAIQGAWPKLMEILPELAESAQHLPPLF